MSNFQITSLRNSSVWGLYRIKDRVEMNPVYQREGDIWTLDKKQLLIDTVVNQFDIPKIYLHKYPKSLERDGNVYDYAVVDGKQRLTAIWEFIDGKFSLSPEFIYLRGDGGAEQVAAGGMAYADLGKNYPNIKTDFDSYALEVVCIETDDVDIIEELFSRLNEAVPLSAPEKRNALPGPLPPAVRKLVGHPFFLSNLPFSNKRYRHYDLAAKMLLIVSRDDVTDTKKAYLDKFFNDGKDIPQSKVDEYTSETVGILDAMHGAFCENDQLLRQIGMVVLYFHVFRRAFGCGAISEIGRDVFETFDAARRSNRAIAESDIARADYGLLEFDRFTQSPNDAYAMRIRLAVIDEKAFDRRLGFPQILGD